MSLVEVIIPTHNRPTGLAEAIAGLRQQTFTDFSLIVVDDASEPAALVAAGNPFEVRVLRTALNGGPGAARNLGLMASKAKAIAFVDDDVVLAPEALARHVEAWQSSGPRSVVIGPLLAPSDWKPTPWNRWEARTLAREYRRMEHGEYRPTWRQFFTGNALAPRAELLAVGAFNSSLRRAEDIELGYRLHRAGCSFVFEPQAVGWHYAQRSLLSWRKIPREYARVDREIDALYPELEWRRQLKTERRAGQSAAARVSRLCTTSDIRSAAAGVLARSTLVVDRIQPRLASSILSVAYRLEYDSAAVVQPSPPRAVVPDAANPSRASERGDA